MEKDFKKKDEHTSRKPWIKLLPAAAVVAAVAITGLHGKDTGETQAVQSADTEIQSASELEKYFGYEEEGSSASQDKKNSKTSAKKTSSKKKSTKKSGIKKSTGNRTVSESARTANAAGQGSTQTPVAEVPANGYKDGIYEGSGTGFGGTITVRVTVSGGKIVSIEILDASGETASYFASAKGVIDRIIASQSPNVDAVSGATYSSNGIIQAVQNALAQAAADSSQASQEPTVTPTPTEIPEPTATPAIPTPNPDAPKRYIDGTYEGSADGYSGKVKVKIKIKNGIIVSISQTNTDTPQFFDSAWGTLEKAILENQTADGIDTVSGATYSSNGILNAVKAALKKAENPDYKKSNKTPTPKPTKKPAKTPKPTKTPTPVPTRTPVIPTSAPGEQKKYLDGTYEGSAAGFDGTVHVTATVRDGVIVALEQTNTDTPQFFDNAWNTLQPLILERQSADGIDTVSGATYSSNGILEAARQAIEKAKNPDYNGGAVTPTAAPGPTATPEPTATPKPTSTPKPTATPVPTATPEPTAVPEPTDTPDIPDGTPTPSPEPTEPAEPTPIPLYKDGSFGGEGFGYNGIVSVTVTISGGQITDISQTNTDTPKFFQGAWESIYPQILAAQTTEGIDTVSGATYSSLGILDAVNEALGKAKNY